ncbi:hypothetical protein ACSBR1_030890 [Camellia fascicularis]
MYVIVFDDVWQSDFWGFIRHALPKNSKGSRVIITTRNEQVVAFCKETSVDQFENIGNYQIGNLQEYFDEKVANQRVTEAENESQS